MHEFRVFTAADAAGLIGIEEAHLVPYARAVIESPPPQYHIVSPKEYDAVLADIVRALARRKFEAVGAHRKLVWERGWNENLAAFVQTNFDINALRPRFMHDDRPFRLHGHFVVAESPDVESQISRFIRTQLFGTWFRSVDAIYEFGAGTGFNILELNQMFPQKNLFGLDWTQASIDIMQNLRTRLSTLIDGCLFDFFSPNHALDLPPDTGVLTSGALEQIGDKFGPFLQYLLEKRPKIVVHLEPMLEYYDESLFFDVLGAEYHRQRGYLQGLVPRLRELDKAGTIKILSEHRTEFGNLYDDGHSFIVWEPC